MIADRRTVMGLLASSAVGALASSAAAAPPEVRNVVLVHGLIADGSCWWAVIERLQARGLNVTAVQIPLTTLAAATAATLRALALQDGPTVLVGHSFGGMFIDEAGIDPKVVALVYVAAVALELGESFPELANRYPPSPASTEFVFAEDWGRLRLDAFLRDFANGVPPQRARVLYAVQQPFKEGLISEKITRAAWHVKPVFYAVSRHDRAIDPDLERFWAKRMGATTIEVDSGHLSLVSHPDEITGLILQAAGQH